MLSAPISDTNSSDTITVADATGLAQNDVIQVDSEQMLITAVAGNSLTVDRGYNGTAAITHNTGAAVLTPQTPSSNYEIDFTCLSAATNQFQATLSNLNTGEAIGLLTITLPAAIAHIDLQGGPGSNLIQVDPSVTRNMHLYGGPGNNTLMAGSGNDTLVAGSGTAVLYGGTGDCLLYGGDEPGQDVVPAASPAFTATYNATPTDGNDTLIAGAGNDELFAGSGADVLIGGSVARQVGRAAPWTSNIGKQQLLPTGKRRRP